MENVQNLATPFIPVRSKAEAFADFFKAYDHLEYLTMIQDYEKMFLQAVAISTTNPKLLKAIPDLNVDEIGELARLSIIALKNLRNQPGRPSSKLTTPWSSRPPSGGASPTKDLDQPREMSPSLLREALERVQAVEESRDVQIAAADTSSPAEQFSSVIGSSVVRKLGIIKEIPSFLTKSITRDRDFAELCQLRERSRCIVTGVETDSGESCHIFPFSSLQGSQKVGFRETWRFLAILLGEDLRDKLAEHLNSEDNGVHTPANGIYMKSDIHKQFDCGKIDLIPIRKSTVAPFYLDVEYIRCYPAQETLPLVRYPREPEKQVSSAAEIITNEPRSLHNRDIIRIISSGDIELPSEVLLFWNNYLRHILRTCGLGKGYVPELDSRTGLMKESSVNPQILMKKKRKASKELGSHLSRSAQPGDGAGDYWLGDRVEADVVYDDESGYKYNISDDSYADEDDYTHDY
ncbi:hypothetical protein TWF694_008951 [Orbilia ellipsospora]|uniref:HNH nuclease domain-containing protein n=1 Tax=Orbilia ellipsospora TaxID=2528407 RepID=A0AAV9XDE7_9PEZI